MDLTAISGLGATGALVIFLGYLLTHIQKDRTQRLAEDRSYDERVDRYDKRLAEMEARIAKLEEEIDHHIGLRRDAEEEAARYKIQLAAEQERSKLLEAALNASTKLSDKP